MTAERLRQLLSVAEAPKRRIIGLMSGTSVDGIDAAIVDIAGHSTSTRLELLHFATIPFKDELRERIHELFEGDVSLLCEMNFTLGEAFADAAIKAVEAAGLKLSSIDAVASPGQTIYHVDPTQGGVPSTLQIGESSVIAERTGAFVVSDFRTRDIAAGGSGAPLVPYVDYILFSDASRSFALQNVGGIANATIVPPRSRPDELVAFDTGPGNMIIDEVVKELRDDDKAYDIDGRYSALGRIDEALLEQLMSHPYLALEPPKSTGREIFGVEFCRQLIEGYDAFRIIDLLATVVRFTAQSIHDAYRRFVIPRHDIARLVVSGGGSHNKTLMRDLTTLFADDGIEVTAWDDFPGISYPGDAKEAIAFAVLANETLQGYASGCPAATGARHPVIQGKLVL